MRNPYETLPLHTPSEEQTRPNSVSQGKVGSAQASPSCWAHTLQHGQSARATIRPRHPPAPTVSSHAGEHSQPPKVEFSVNVPSCAHTTQGNSAKTSDTRETNIVNTQISFV